MVYITTKKLLLCLVSFFSYASCMEITQLPKDAFTPIAGQLTLIERHNVKNSCKSLHQKLSEEPLFLPLFNSENYFKFISIQRNYVPLEQIASAQTILKLKIFAARHKEDKAKKMFWDLIERCPESGCKSPHCAINEPLLQDRVLVYAKEWRCDKVGNWDHFAMLMWIIEKAHSCRGYLDLVLAQGIDVNAWDSSALSGRTALCVTCGRDEHAWATKKLIDHPLCNVNVRYGVHETTPFKNAIFGCLQGASIINMKILLTRADLDIEGVKYGTVQNLFGTAKNLLLTAYPFLDEQK